MVGTVAAARERVERIDVPGAAAAFREVVNRTVERARVAFSHRERHNIHPVGERVDERVMHGRKVGEVVDSRRAVHLVIAEKRFGRDALNAR